MSTSLAAPADRSIAAAVTYLFIGGSLFTYVRLPNGADVYLRIGELATIAVTGICVIALARRTESSHHVSIVRAVVAATALIVAYELAWPLMRGQTIAQPSLLLGFAAMSSCCVALAFARLFYSSEVFRTAFSRATLLAVSIGIAAYALQVATGSGWLVHLQYGTPRLQGFLSEPSGWAPYLAALVLVAFGRRRYVVTAIGLGAVVLTKSPTVVVVLGLSVPAYYFLATGRQWLRVAIGVLGAGGGGAAFLWLDQVDTTGPLAPTTYDQTMVKLAEGVQNITSGGTAGRNDRFHSTQSILTELSDHHWLLFGIGPGSEGYIEATTGLLPNSLAAYALASFGLVGLVGLTALLIRTVLRLRRTPDLRLFLPFIIASLINSAGGWESYTFVVVAIVVAGLVRPSSPVHRLPVLDSGTAPAARPPVRDRQALPACPEFPVLIGRRVPDGVS